MTEKVNVEKANRVTTFSSSTGIKSIHNLAVWQLSIGRVINYSHHLLLNTKILTSSSVYQMIEENPYHYFYP